MEIFYNKLLHEFNPPFQNSVLMFAVILFIILLSPILLRKMRIPGIIGLIISGVIIGPHGMNLIERNSAIELFSTIGLLYILFIAGLELDMNSFRQTRYKSILFGSMTFLIPMLIGYPVCRYILDYGVSASLITTSLFATHTLVAYPIVSRMGIARNQSVEVTVGGTIITDTAVLILLAVIVGYNTAGNAALLWPRLIISFGLFLVVVLYLIPRISAWFFSKLEAEKHSHYIYVLSVLFFCAFLAELAGLEPIIGAFAAGLALNRLIPATSSLMNRIEFAGNSLFIPFFLISVGMLVDLRVIFRGLDLLFVAGILIAVAIFSKWVAAWITASILRYSRSQRQLMFGLSTARAAATLAIILVGIENKIVDVREQNAIILLILVTCLISSIITEAAAKKVAIESATADVDTALNNRKQKFVVLLANPVTMERLLDLAISMHIPRNTTPITGLAVVIDNEEAERKLLETSKSLEKLQQHRAAADYKLELKCTIDQNVASGIKRATTEVFATDLIIGFSGRNRLTDILFGKTMQYIIDQTSQTVYVSGLMSPINIHNRLLLFMPPFIEKDKSISSLLTNIMQLASDQGMKLLLYASAATESAIKNWLHQTKNGQTPAYNSFPGWESFEHIQHDILSNDIIVMIIPRFDTVAYSVSQNALLERVEKMAEKTSFMLVYPGRHFTGHSALTGDFSTRYIGNRVDHFAKSAKDILKSFEDKTK